MTPRAPSSIQGELVVPLRGEGGRVAPVTHVRSTLIASSMQTLRTKNLLDAYLQQLPPSLHATMLGTVAGSWMPLALAMAHYAAADALGLSVQEQFDNGREVAERIQNSMLGTLVRAARGAGLTPWTGLDQFQRLWDRLLRGGAGAVYRLGPKEARVEAHGVPLIQFAYFRNAWRGMFAGSGALFCNRIFVTEIAGYLRERVFAVRLAWA